MGHWIKNCPLNTHHDSTHTEVKRSTGIPRSFIDGMLITFYVPKSFGFDFMNTTIYFETFTFLCDPTIKAGNAAVQESIINLPPVEKKQEIPDDLICSICKDLFTDAVMIPCCGSSFCDECKHKSINNKYP